MEVAGLMDYSRTWWFKARPITQTNKRTTWRGQRAATSAAYAKEYLGVIPSTEVSSTPTSAPLGSTQGHVKVSTSAHVSFTTDWFQAGGVTFTNYAKVNSQAAELHITGEHGFQLNTYSILRNVKNWSGRVGMVEFSWHDYNPTKFVNHHWLWIWAGFLLTSLVLRSRR